MKQIGLVLFTVASMAFAGVVEDSGVKGGVVVQLGVDSGKDLEKLLVNDRYLVQGLEKDAKKIAKARKYLREEGKYGRISVREMTGEALPYSDNQVNLIVETRDKRQETRKDEILRVLVPGGVAIIDGKKTVKPRPAAMDDWTHYLWGPDNNAVSKDTIVAQPRSIQWVADPIWARSHEQMASTSAVVSEGGRVTYIEDVAPRVSIRYIADWKLTCRDAYNGTLLWQKDIGLWSDHLRHFRTGPLHLPRRLVAVDGKIYVTMSITDPVSVLDGDTGETIRVLKGTERTDEIVVDNGIMYLVIGTSEASRHGDGASFYERGEPKATTYRLVRAIDLKNDKVLWEKDFSKQNYILPLSLTVLGDNVYYQNLKGVGCLDANKGKEKWLTPRETVAVRMAFSAPTVVATDEILLVADRDIKKPAPPKKEEPAKGKKAKKRRPSMPVPPAVEKVEWGIHGWGLKDVPRGGSCTLVAYSATDGKELWRMPAGEIYNSPVDVFVVGDMVYVSTSWDGFDINTGEKKFSSKGRTQGVAMAHDRCYRNKASVNYIFTGRDGIELIDLEKGWIGNNSWIRGTCQYGIMPANGLMYTPQNACGCHNQVQLQGFFAAAPRRSFQDDAIKDEDRLTKGPAYGKINHQPSAINHSSDWPMYRANGERGGAVKTEIAGELKKAWSVKITGIKSTLTRSQLTQALCVGDTVYIAVKDEHTIYALDAGSGKEKWSFTTGSRIDSAPTYYKGMIISGSADGSVYCVRAKDGELAWKFKAAPREMFVNVYGQLESAWPVHGSVLVHKDELYFTAGRSTYLDDGFVYYRLNPVTGEMLARNQVVLIDPETDKQTGKERAAKGFHMEGTMTDIMTSTGDTVSMKYMQFDKNGKVLPEIKTHLWSATSMLAEEWFVRTYWFYGNSYGGGWGGWANSGSFPSGRIMSFDDDGIFGYGRARISGGATGHTADQYHLFKHDGWADTQTPPIVRAMVKAGDKIVAAGPVDTRKKDSKMLAYEDEKDALASYLGENGIKMRVLNAADGAVLSEVDLDAIPAFDGMSAANGKVFIALKNGELQCWK